MVRIWYLATSKASSLLTPFWPQANATVERFNWTIEKAIGTAHIEGKDWRQQLDPFLLTYCATTGISPAQDYVQT